MGAGQGWMNSVILREKSSYIRTESRICWGGYSYKKINSVNVDRVPVRDLGTLASRSG